MEEINKEIIKSAFKIGDKINANSILINIDILKKKGEVPDYFLEDKKVVLVTKDDIGGLNEIYRKRVINLPKADISRMSQVKFATISGLCSGILNKEWVIIFITGVLFYDTIMIIDIKKENSVFNFLNFDTNIKPEVFLTILNIAMELASHGKNGRPVGTIFVLGDKNKVLKLSKQMIINPFKGYSKVERNLLNPYLKETIKEFSSIDGAFIISDDGLVITAGRYLNVSFIKSLPFGLGSRHMSAAGITSKSKAIAITISESTGTIRIFKDGKILEEIERY